MLWATHRKLCASESQNACRICGKSFENSGLPAHELRCGRLVDDHDVQADFNDAYGVGDDSEDAVQPTDPDDAPLYLDGVPALQEVLPYPVVPGDQYREWFPGTLDDFVAAATRAMNINDNADATDRLILQAFSRNPGAENFMKALPREMTTGRVADAFATCNAGDKLRTPLGWDFYMDLVCPDAVHAVFNLLKLLDLPGNLEQYDFRRSTLFRRASVGGEPLLAWFDGKAYQNGSVTAMRCAVSPAGLHPVLAHERNAILALFSVTFPAIPKEVYSNIELAILSNVIHQRVAYVIQKFVDHVARVSAASENHRTISNNLIWVPDRAGRASLLRSGAQCIRCFGSLGEKLHNIYQNREVRQCFRKIAPSSAFCLHFGVPFAAFKPCWMHDCDALHKRTLSLLPDLVSKPQWRSANLAIHDSPSCRHSRMSSLLQGGGGSMGHVYHCLVHQTIAVSHFLKPSIAVHFHSLYLLSKVLEHAAPCPHRTQLLLHYFKSSLLRSQADLVEYYSHKSYRVADSSQSSSSSDSASDSSDESDASSSTADPPSKSRVNVYDKQRRRKIAAAAQADANKAIRQQRALKHGVYSKFHEILFHACDSKTWGSQGVSTSTFESGLAVSSAMLKPTGGPLRHRVTHVNRLQGAIGSILMQAEDAAVQEVPAELGTVGLVLMQSVKSRLVHCGKQYHVAKSVLLTRGTRLRRGSVVLAPTRTRALHVLSVLRTTANPAALLLCDEYVVIESPVQAIVLPPDLLNSALAIAHMLLLCGSVILRKVTAEAKIVPFAELDPDVTVFPSVCFTASGAHDAAAATRWRDASVVQSISEWIAEPPPDNRQRRPHARMPEAELSQRISGEWVGGHDQRVILTSVDGKVVMDYFYMGVKRNIRDFAVANGTLDFKVMTYEVVLAPNVDFSRLLYTCGSYYKGRMNDFVRVNDNDVLSNNAGQCLPAAAHNRFYPVRAVNESKAEKLLVVPSVCHRNLRDARVGLDASIMRIIPIVPQDHTWNAFIDWCRSPEAYSVHSGEAEGVLTVVLADRSALPLALRVRRSDQEDIILASSEAAYSMLV